VPTDLEKPLAKDIEDGVVHIEDGRHGGNDAEAAPPDFCNAGSKIPSELSVMDFSQLTEYRGTTISPHREYGGEVFDEEDSVAGGGVGVFIGGGGTELFEQPRFTVTIEPA
jgi:hypothetical protein